MAPDSFADADAPSLRLPSADGLCAYTIRNAPLDLPARAGTMNRIAYAAAHIVVDPLADIDPWEGRAIDWDATIAFREHLWSLGLGVAEAMDTAQRGMGLDWRSAQELIRRSQAAAERISRPLARLTRSPVTAR